MGTEKIKFGYCNVVGSTDVGCKRTANEDFLGTQETVNGLVAVVCDGMGGHVGGATASHIAVKSILDFLNSSYYDNPRKAIVEAINAANKAILYHTTIQPELKGMGSTCVLLIVREGKVYIGSVGDSRVYLVRNRRITQLTKDQSFVQMLVDLGQITPEQAEHHPRKNEITNALGLPTMQEATVLEQDILPMAGDCFLLCSDGLSGMVSNHEIEKVVSRQTELSSQERADLLIQKAKDAGGLDNITVELVEFSVTPKVHKTSYRKLWYILPLLVAVAFCLGLLCYNNNEEPKVSVIKRIESKTLPEVFEFVESCNLLEILYGSESSILMYKGLEFWNLPVVLSDSIVCYGVELVEGNKGVRDFIRVRFQPSSDTLFVVLKTENVDYKVIIPVLKVREKNEIQNLDNPVSPNPSMPYIKGGEYPEIIKDSEYNPQDINEGFELNRLQEPLQNDSLTIHPSDTTRMSIEENVDVEEQRKKAQGEIDNHKKAEEPKIENKKLV